jgi:Fe-S-cluster containining protein
MSSTKGEFLVAWQNIQKFNKRLPVNLDREQDDLPKLLRKPRSSDPFKALAILYDYFDRFFAPANSLVACHQGCGYCCHIGIGLYQVEADYIAASTGAAAKKVLPDPTRKASSWFDPARPCPFLRDNACSIYAYRPMTCRTHFNFEPTNRRCQFDSPDDGMALLDRNASLPGAMKAYSELVARHGGGGADIRDFFGHST